MSTRFRYVKMALSTGCRLSSASVLYQWINCDIRPPNSLWYGANKRLDLPKIIIQILITNFYDLNKKMTVERSDRRILPLTHNGDEYAEFYM